MCFFLGDKFNGNILLYSSGQHDVLMVTFQGHLGKQECIRRIACSRQQSHSTRHRPYPNMASQEVAKTRTCYPAWNSELRTQNSLFRSVQPGDSTLRLIGVAIMRVTFCDIYYSLLMQFTQVIQMVVDNIVFIA